MTFRATRTPRLRDAKNGLGEGSACVHANVEVAVALTESRGVRFCLFPQLFGVSFR